jgi:hypothetical protein
MSGVNCGNLLTTPSTLRSLRRSKASAGTLRMGLADSK